MYFIGIFLLYILAAVLPALFLLVFVYRHDRIEKEPPKLLWQLFFLGAVSAGVAGTIEGVGVGILDALFSPGSAIYTIFLAFLVVAVVEEGVKFFFMKRLTWRNPHFNFRFDGIVYAVFVSLGFAALENILYVFGYGLSVAPLRALLAIPGHMSFAVFMGYYYGRAKLAYNAGDYGRAREDLILGYVIATLLHGFYDTCAMIGTYLSLAIFFAFIAVMFVIVFKTLRKESKTDTPL